MDKVSVPWSNESNLDFETHVVTRTIHYYVFLEFQLKFNCLCPKLSSVQSEMMEEFYIKEKKLHQTFDTAAPMCVGT